MNPILLIALSLIGISITVVGYYLNSRGRIFSFSMKGARALLPGILFWLFVLALFYIYLPLKTFMIAFYVWGMIGFFGFMMYTKAHGTDWPLLSLAHVPHNINYWMPYVKTNQSTRKGIPFKIEIGLTSHSVDVNLSSSSIDMDALERGELTFQIERSGYQESAIMERKSVKSDTPINLSLYSPGFSISPTEQTVTIKQLVNKTVCLKALPLRTGVHKLWLEFSDPNGKTIGEMTVPIKVESIPHQILGWAFSSLKIVGPAIFLAGLLLLLIAYNKLSIPW